MPDGSIKFDVQLDTSDFKKNLDSMANSSKDALQILDDAINAGAVSGISSMEALAESSFSKLMEFSEEEKQFLISSSKSAVKTEEERQNDICNIRRSAASEELRKLTEEERLREEMISREYSQLKNSLDLGLISHEEYYLKLREYRDKYFSVGSEEWEEYTIDILKYCKDTSEELAKVQKKAILSVFEEMSSQVDESYEELLKTCEKMENKLKNYGSLYSEKSFTSPAGGNTYSWLALSDIQGEIKTLENYNNALSATKELLYKVFPTSGEGLSKESADKNKQYIKEFFSLLSDMSVEEGLTFSAFLNRMPSESAGEYLTAWSKKQNLAREISKNLYSDEAMEIYNTNIEHMAGDMISKLEESFGDLPDNFFDEGVAAALGFGEGFIQSIESVFNTIRSRINAGLSTFTPSLSSVTGSSIVTNSTSYNIYGNDSAKSTALEIYKQDTLKRMLVGEY